MGQSCLPVKLQGKKDNRSKIRHYDPKEDKDFEKNLNSKVEHNAAVDYAMKKNN